MSFDASASRRAGRRQRTGTILGVGRAAEELSFRLEARPRLHYGPLRVVREDDSQLVEGALERRPEAVRALLHVLTPVIQARVAKALTRRPLAGRDVRQEVLDLAQEVFVVLFADDGRILRAWDPARGASLKNFVGLVAEREVLSILRSGRRSPFSEDPTEGDVLTERRGGGRDLESDVASRDFATVLLARLEAELSPLGLQIFEALWGRQLSVEETAALLGMSHDAVYAWQSRLKKKARALADALESPQEEAR